MMDVAATKPAPGLFSSAGRGFSRLFGTCGHFRGAQMARSRTYRPTKVDVSLDAELRATWTFQSKTFRGNEFIYQVVDRNFDRLNQWTFSVKVPRTPGQIVVQPQRVPGKKVFAGLERRPVTFQGGLKRPYDACVYCKAFFSDPTRSKNRTLVRGWELDSLPQWFKYFEADLHVKSKVAIAAGADGNAVVILVNADDHERMIRIYFALRVWVLQERIVIHK
jgi:hypothetical protein